MKKFLAVLLVFAAVPCAGQAATRTKRAKAEACEVTYGRLRQEIEAIDKDHLQRCFYDETCTQEEKCDWYITENDYFRNLSTIIAACGKVPEQEKEVARYSAAVKTTDALVARCTTGDLAGGSTAPLTKEARARRIKTAIQHARASGRGGLARPGGHARVSVPARPRGEKKQ